MINFFRFAFSRYAYGLSYIAAFLAGVCIVLPVVYMAVPLLAACVLGSLSAYYRHFPVHVNKKENIFSKTQSGKDGVQDVTSAS